MVCDIPAAGAVAGGLLLGVGPGVVLVPFRSVLPLVLSAAKVWRQA